MAGQVMIMDMPFTGPSNIQRSRQWDSQYSLNLYTQVDPVLNQKVLYPYMGFKKIDDFEVGENDFRGRAGGAIGTDIYTFYVIGNRLIRRDINLAQTIVGVLDTTIGPVSMELQGQYVVIADGAHQYDYNILLNTFTISSSPATPLNPTCLVQQQGFLLSNSKNTQTLAQTPIYQPSGYNALSNIQINYKSSPSSYPLLGMRSINGRILTFTTGFGEILDIVGTAGFTFRPNENLTFGYGAINNSSIAVGNGGLTGQQQPTFANFISLAGGLIKCMTTTGNPPIIISTPSVEYRISNLPDRYDAISNIISINGNTFWECSWTNDDLTLVYNHSTKEWFDVQYLGGRSPVEAYVPFKSRHFFSSYQDAGFYELSENIYTQNNFPMKIQRITKKVKFPGLKKATITRVMMEFEYGVGLAGGIDPNAQNFVFGSDPTVSLAASFDGGRVWQEPQTASLGRIGHTEGVVEFEAFGTTRYLNFKIDIQSPVPVFILSMQVYYILSEGTQ